MNKAEAKKRTKLLRKEIEHHRYLYHVLDKPEISDSTYDALFKELINIESEYPDLIVPESPSQRVGGEPVKKFAEIRHGSPMLSLEDVSGPEEFGAWVSRISRLYGQIIGGFFAEVKVDGLALSLVYENGLLKYGATRGNGEIGEDVTHNIRTIVSIPLVLRTPTKKDLASAGVSDAALGEINNGRVEVRGEVFLDKKAFKKINKEQQDVGLPLYANPRNTAAGTVRQLDPKIAASRSLDFFAYGITSDLGQTYHSQEHELLKALGFKTDPNAKTLTGVREVLDHFSLVEGGRDNLPFEIDGIVVSINSRAVFSSLGVVGRAPRGAVAFKFASQQATTRVINIETQVGRTGILTPVANLEPVIIGGVTVKRSTLHNAEEIERLDVRPGDTVVIERAGDVIPRVVSVVKKLRTAGAKKFSMPKKCPVCNTSVVRDGVYVRCINDTCPAVAKEKIYHTVSRGAFDIEGLGPKIIDKLWDAGVVRDSADIFSVGVEDLLKLEGFAQRSAEKVFAQIQDSKEISLERFLYALGILHVGVETARDLALHFGDVEKILNSTKEELEAIENIGGVVSESIYIWFKNSGNRELIKKFLRSGIKIKQSQAAPVSTKLGGKTFVFTGELEGIDRDSAEERVRALGGKTTSSVSKKTDYVVVGENPGSKYEKATELGVKVIGKAEFLKLLE